MSIVWWDHLVPIAWRPRRVPDGLKRRPTVLNCERPQRERDGLEVRVIGNAAQASRRCAAIAPGPVAGSIDGSALNIAVAAPGQQLPPCSQLVTELVCEAPPVTVLADMSHGETRLHQQLEARRSSVVRVSVEPHKTRRHLLESLHG